MEPIIFFGKEININPIALDIGPFQIHWYGIIIVSALVFALYCLKKKDGMYNIKYDDVFDFAFGVLVSGFLCARIYYVLFNLDYYLANPSEILMIWHGGIAIYGGLIGAFLYGLYFCKKKKINFWDFADLLIPYLTFAQCIRQMGKLY